MDRLLIFADDSLGFPQVLLPHIHSCIKKRGDLDICGVVDATKKKPPSRGCRMLRAVATAWVKKIFNFEQKLEWGPHRCRTLAGVCADLDVRLFVPPGRDINDREFVDFLKRSLRPTLGLAIGCLQIFRSDLIGLFDILVNYHNGLLPRYSGLRATSWSVYFAERSTGFTFHRVNEIIDGGNILLQAEIPIAEGDPPGDLDLLKTIKAGEHVGEVLDKMVARDEGLPQGEKRHYFGRNRHEAITTIDDPGALPYAELQRRLFAFGSLNIKVQGAYYPVTRIRPCPPGSLKETRLAIVSEDRIAAKLVRFRHLPFPLYAVYRCITRRAGTDQEKAR
jgi:methionyl-tRNA formyltransferase